MRLTSLVSLVGGVLAVSPQANADSRTASLTVSAVVVDQCSVAATPVAGHVQVNCSVGTTYGVANSGGGISPRVLVASAQGQIGKSIKTVGQDVDAAPSADTVTVTVVY